MAKKGESITPPNADSVRVAPDPGLEAEYRLCADDREKISRLAYSHWEARGCPIGSPEEDWYRAERELRTSITAAATA